MEEQYPSLTHVHRIILGKRLHFAPRLNTYLKGVQSNHTYSIRLGQESLSKGWRKANIIFVSYNQTICFGVWSLPNRTVG